MNLKDVHAEKPAEYLDRKVVTDFKETVMTKPSPVNMEKNEILMTKCEVTSDALKQNICLDTENNDATDSMERKGGIEVEKNTIKPRRKYVRKKRPPDSTDSTKPKDISLLNGVIPLAKERKKPGPKPGSKRKPKTLSAPNSQAAKKRSVETIKTDQPPTADDDTMDYNVLTASKQETPAESQTDHVTGVVVSKPDTQARESQDISDKTVVSASNTTTAMIDCVLSPPCNTQPAASNETTADCLNATTERSSCVENKVVTIDNIEIRELSDLNSSRDESDDDAAATAHHRSQPPAASPTHPVPTFINMADCEQEDKTYACSYPACVYRGKNRVCFRKHLSHHHIYLCAHCDFHCNIFDELERHMTANHPQRWGRKKCKKCQRYIKGDGFAEHETVCDGTTTFPCTQCERVFQYASKLLDHERKFHAHVKCERCDHVAENKHSLQRHVWHAHPKPKKPRTKKVTKPPASLPEKTEPESACIYE